VKVTVLGSGTSQGVPFIACDCAVCRSGDPRDKRTRPSILIDLEPRAASDEPRATSHEPRATSLAVRYVLVDTTPDLRQQCLANHVTRVDAILFTHSHADHICGFDDIRRFNQLQQTAIPCYGDAETLADLRRMFSYVFTGPKQQGGGVPQVRAWVIGGPFTLGGADIVPVPLLHGIQPVLGFRLGSFAYMTDCNRIPDASWPLLAGVTTIVIDALRTRPHSTHFSVDQAVDVWSRLGAERAYFTHITHDLGHAETCARLPRGVELAYDGLVIDL
jgi:phosphoribosyl 1,2-cyclic phosphate phosphodiesterase